MASKRDPKCALRALKRFALTSAFALLACGPRPPSGGTGGTGGSGVGGAGGQPLLGAKFVGNITTNGQIRPDFATYWNQLTPENEGKWGSVERVRGVMNWAQVDAAYRYAKDHGFPYKQHT